MRNKELAREIRILSTDLYLGLPFYKKHSIQKWYKTNNTDVTGQYEDCVKTAFKMIRERDLWLMKILPVEEVPAYCKECINYAPNSVKKYCKTGIKMINKKKCMYHRLAKLTNKKQK